MQDSVRKAMGISLAYLLVALIFLSCSPGETPQRILVFTKTVGFRHIDAIEAGIPALLKLGQEQGYIVDTTERSSDFNETNLKRYQAVVFLNVSGEVFNAEEQTSFQRYIQAGGGFLALHAPTDAERGWPWYGQLIGAYFKSHPADPNVQKGTYVVQDKNHAATDSLPQRFEREDEFYDFDIVNNNINVLVTIDETSYRGGRMGDKHPAVWYHDYDGGRSFYSAMGHTTESYDDPYFLKILAGGLKYVTGGDKPSKFDFSKSVPEENRFTKNVLAEKLDEPMHLAISKEGRVFFVQRKGGVFEFMEKEQKPRLVGNVPASIRYEDGVLGMTLDPDFSNNKRIYVFYSAADGLSFRVSRFTLNNNEQLDPGSEKILIKIPKDILDGSHTGGGLIFDPKGNGNLFITVGDNSSPREWGYGPIDERKGKEHWDAQRSSGNTNDLRGKILRIHPGDDGTYTIPDGNLFAKSIAGTRPEIYSMGHRQPWRISIDTKTGWLYIGEVGPDANDDSASFGPRGYDEFNQVRGPGNFGWPYFVGNNKPYADYDFATKKSNGFFDPLKPENSSVNNTGLKELPPANPAFIWYPYNASKEFPLTGNGGRSATGGPVFRQADFKNAPNTFPAYYEGKWFITDWIRGWINVVTMDEKGNYKSMERFMPGHSFSNPMDMQFGPDGSLYMLEYGKGWFRANDDARLVKIVYNKGNRKPVVEISSDIRAGAIPFTVKLSSKGTVDYDNDVLTYHWELLKDGKVVQTSNAADPSFTLNAAGAHKAKISVKDAQGATTVKVVDLVAGNAPPEVDIAITKGNSSFYFPGTTIEYAISIRDKEDGSSDFSGSPGSPGSPGSSASSDAAEKIRKSAVVSMDQITGYYKPLLGDPDPTAANETLSEISLYGGMVLNSSDCYSCHSIDQKSAGPPFKDIAEKYKNDKNAGNYLVQKIVKGGSGVWGEVAMSAHPDLDKAKVAEMTKFILSLATPAPSSMPLKGDYKFNIPARKKSPEATTDAGVFVLKAAYKDKGADNVFSQKTEKSLVLRNPSLTPGDAEVQHDIMRVKIPGLATELAVFYGNNCYVGFRGIDMTGIKSINVNVSSGLGGVVEIRKDRPDGPVIGSSGIIATGKGSFSVGPQVTIPVNETIGKNDIYLVVKGTGVKKKSDIVFIITHVKFINQVK